MPRPSLTTKTATATSVAAAFALAVGVTAMSVSVALWAAAPLLRPQGFRIAAVAGGGGGHEADPTPVIRLRYADRDDAALGLVNIGADKGVFNAVEQTADGGFIMVGGAQRVGRTDFDVVVVKARAAKADDPAQEGAVEWVKYINPSDGEYDAASAVQQTDDDGDGQRDDGFIVTGTSSGQGRTNMSLLKLNPQGDLDPSWGAQNPVRYSTPAVSGRDEAYDVEPVLGVDGQPDGYLMVGKSGYYNGTVFVSDVGVVRADRLGQPDLRWHDAQVPHKPLTFGTEAAYEVGYAVQQSNDGFIIAGSSAGTEGTNPHPLILRIDPDGKQRQITVLDPLGTARSVTPTFDRLGAGSQPTGYVVTGSLAQDAPRYEEAFLLKLTPQATTDAAWTPNPRTYGGDGTDSSNSVIQLFDPQTEAATGFMFAGASSSQDPAFQTDGQIDVYAVRTDLMGLAVTTYLPHLEGADQTNAIRAITGSPSAYVSVGAMQIIDPTGQQETRQVPELIFYPGGSGPKPEPTFRRGDSDDNGAVNLTDVVFTLNALFKGGPQPTCPDAADADDNGVVNLSDAAFTLNYLFKGSGLLPLLPGPESRGPDPTPDDLEMCTYNTP